MKVTSFYLIYRVFFRLVTLIETKISQVALFPDNLADFVCLQQATIVLPLQQINLCA